MATQCFCSGCKGGDQIQLLLDFCLMTIPKERNQKIGQAKEGLSCNKILQLNSEAMKTRVSKKKSLKKKM